MRNHSLACIGIIASSLIYNQVNGQMNGIVLELKFPEPPLLYMEENSIYLSVRNESDHPLPLMTSLQKAIKYQIKIDLGLGSIPYRYQHLPVYYQSVSWDDIVTLADKVLKPGQSHIWEWEGYGLMEYPNLLSEISNSSATNIAISLRVENNQWVSTPPLPITVLTAKASKAITDKAVPVLETTFWNQFTGQSWPISLNKLEINGKTYLFTPFGTRICELPNGEIPTIQNDVKGTGFTLTFPTTQRRVRYNTNKMKIEADDIPK